jgi:hypothetical protein
VNEPRLELHGDFVDLAQRTRLTARAANAARNAHFRPADATNPAVDVALAGGQI